MQTRRRFLAVAIAAPASTLLSNVPASATAPEVFMEDGVAIRGADTVAYFAQGAPVLGTSEFSVKWRGAIWFFASSDNMEIFMGNPHAFMPQFGGYCALDLTNGILTAPDPEAWTIFDDKLYLTNSIAARRVWSEDKVKNIELARTNWSTIFG